MRLVIDDFREDVTKIRKDGTRGSLRVAYGDPHRPDVIEPAVSWMWRFIDGAKTAAELYGRALVIIAAEQYATRLVVPSSQQHPPARWSSHKDRAAKALKKIVGAHLPAELKTIERAIARADRERQNALSRTADKTAESVTGDESSDAVE